MSYGCWLRPFCTEMGIAAENCHISFSALRRRREKRGDGLKVVVTLTNAVLDSARPREKSGQLSES